MLTLAEDLDAWRSVYLLGQCQCTAVAAGCGREARDKQEKVPIKDHWQQEPAGGQGQLSCPHLVGRGCVSKGRLYLTASPACRRDQPDLVITRLQFLHQWRYFAFASYSSFLLKIACFLGPQVRSRPPTMHLNVENKQLTWFLHTKTSALP